MLAKSLTGAIDSHAVTGDDGVRRCKITTAWTLEIPNAPSAFAASAAGDTQINLTWTNGTNGTIVYIEVSTDGAAWSALATTAINATSHAHTGLSASTTRYYRARAYKSGLYSDYTSTTSATTSATPPSNPIYVDYASGNDSTGTGLTGAPYKTLTRALSVAAGGQAIVLRGNSGSVYYESGPMTVSASNLTIRADSGHTPHVTIASAYASWTQYAASNAYWTSTGETYTRNAWNGGSALAVVADLATVQSTANSWWHDTTDGKLYVNVGGGSPGTIHAVHNATALMTITGDTVSISDVTIWWANNVLEVTGDDATLTDCTIARQQGDQIIGAVINKWAVRINGASGATFDNLTATFRKSGGLYFYNGAATGTVTGCTFTNDTATGTNYTLSFQSGTGHTVNNTTITGGFQAAFHAKQSGTTVTFTDCTAIDFLRMGFYADDGSTVTCTRCLAYLTYDINYIESYGFAADTDTDRVLNANMTLYHCTAANLERNTGATSLGMFGFGFNTDGTVIVKNCIAYKCKIGIGKAGSPTFTENYNCCNLNGSANYYGFSRGTNSITSGPTFTDQANNNYTLLVGSPCIDTGVAISGVNDGYAGSAPDMGYWEYR